MTTLNHDEIRARLAAATPGPDFTDKEWREYQSIPDQGYSHRDWLNARNREVLAALLDENEQLRAGVDETVYNLLRMRNTSKAIGHGSCAQYQQVALDRLRAALAGGDNG